MDDGSFPAGSGPLSVSVPDNACWGRSVGGEDGLPPRVPEGRSFGCRGADKDCSSRYRRLRPRSACHCPAVVYALLQPQQPLGSSEAWRATGRQGLLYPRGIDRPAAIMCGCPGACSGWCIHRWRARGVGFSRHARQGWKVVAAYGQGCTGRAVSQCSCGLSVSPDRGQTTRTCP